METQTTELATFKHSTVHGAICNHIREYPSLVGVPEDVKKNLENDKAFWKSVHDFGHCKGYDYRYYDVAMELLSAFRGPIVENPMGVLA